MFHIFLLITFSFLLVDAKLQSETFDENAASDENMLRTLADMAKTRADVPPYDPSKPVAPTPEEPQVEIPINPNMTDPTVPPTDQDKKPYYPYYPYYDESWRKCCKLEKAKECCLEKTKNLPLYNLGTGLYYFHNDMTTAKNWIDALHFCRAHGMELASIETAAENSMLQSYVQWFLGGTADFYSFYWTSLNDLGTEGTFTWAGTGQTASYFSWHMSGQPDGGVWENCGEMWQTPVGTVLWNDRDCLKWRGRFICEMPKPCSDIIYAGYE